MNTWKQKIIITFLIISVVSAGGVMVSQNQKNTLNSRAVETLAEKPSPTPTVFIPGPMKSETMDSPDGAATFTMESQSFETNVRYWFFNTEASDHEKRLIFSREWPLAQTLSIPYNAWSPDNKYVFLQETKSSARGYIVFSVNGEMFDDDVRYLQMDELFATKVPRYTITEITGWAAPNLLLVNTVAEEDGTRVSFWFDVPSQSFIRLSTYFR
jgi:hypothetical protein